MIVQPVLAPSSQPEDISRQDGNVQQEVRKWLRTVTPKALAEWMAALPKSNPSAAAHQQLHALKLLDEIDLQLIQKFALLDVVRAGAYQSVDAMTSGFMSTTTGFSESFKAIINQAMLLQGQLASCYTNVAIRAKLSGEQHLFIMGSALHRAMMDQYTMLAFYLQLHLPVPPQLWRQLHRLYKVAEDSQLLAHVMGDNVFVSEQMLTIKQIYIAALLLGASRSTQLHADDVAITAKALKKWALQAELGKVPETALEWQLAVDIAGGNAAHFEITTTFAGVDSWRFLHTKKLATYLPKQGATTIRIADRSVIPDQQLLRHLLTAWSEFVERDNTRRTREDSVVTAIGIAAVHYYLTGGMQPDEFMGQTGTTQQHGSGRQLVIGQVPESFHLHTCLPADISRLENPLHPWHETRVINESITGYCLEWPSSLTTVLSTGVVIGIKESFAPYWKIAEVVWVRKNGDDTVRTGIRILGNESIPLAVRTPHAVTGREQVMPGFLLSPDRELGTDKATFLSPNVKMKMGEQIHIAQESNEQTLQLLEPVKETAGYSQFDCAFVVPAP